MPMFYANQVAKLINSGAMATAKNGVDCFITVDGIASRISGIISKGTQGEQQDGRWSPDRPSRFCRLVVARTDIDSICELHQLKSAEVTIDDRQFGVVEYTGGNVMVVLQLVRMNDEDEEVGL